MFISLQAVSHHSSASRRSVRDMPGSSGSKIPVSASAHDIVGEDFDEDFIEERDEQRRRHYGGRVLYDSSSAQAQAYCIVLRTPRAAFRVVPES